MLLEGEKIGMAGMACDIAALLEERDPLGRDAGADLRLRLDALRHFRLKTPAAGEKGILRRVEKLSHAWRRILRCSAQSEIVGEFEAGQLLFAAYPERISKRISGAEQSYRLGNSRRAALQPHDVLADYEWLAIGLMGAGQQEGRVYLAAPIDPKIFAGKLKQKTQLTWNHQQGQLLARTVESIGHLELSSKPLPKVEAADIVPVLCAAIREEPNLLPWSDQILAWQARVMSLKLWRPDEDWPDVSKPALLEKLEAWLGPYIGQVKRRDDFKRINLLGLLQGMLPWPKGSELDQLAPSKIEVPTGSEIRLKYFEDGKAPILAVRLQEMFGMMETPTINQGRTQVLIHLLSPGYKPCAVTQDLKSFWQNAYQDVRKDLRGRYKKHHWPEDPFKAEPMRGTKKQNRK